MTHLEKVHAAIKVKEKELEDCGMDYVVKRNQLEERMDILKEGYKHLQTALENHHNLTWHNLRKFDTGTEDYYSRINNRMDLHYSDLETAYRTHNRRLDNDYEDLVTAYNKRRGSLEEELATLRSQQWQALEQDIKEKEASDDE